MKWFISIVVLLVIAGAGLWWSGLLNPYLPGNSAATNQQATTTPATQQPAAQPNNDLPTSQSDASDAAIVQDSAAVDAQMQSLGTDQSNVDSSMNDKAGSEEF